MTDASDETDGLDGRRWVRIMCDFAADGVWNHHGESVDAEDLPISPGLVTRIRAWQETYEASDPDDSPDFDWTSFDAEGWSIARDVKAALPDWTVIYFDEARRRRGAWICEVEIG